MTLLKRGTLIQKNSSELLSVIKYVFRALWLSSHLRSESEMWTGNKNCHPYTGSFVRVDILLLLHSLVRASPEGRSWRSYSSTLSIPICASRKPTILESLSHKRVYFSEELLTQVMLHFIGKTLSKGMHFQIFHLTQDGPFLEFLSHKEYGVHNYIPLAHVQLSMLVLHIPTMYWEK